MNSREIAEVCRLMESLKVTHNITEKIVLPEGRSVPPPGEVFWVALYSPPAIGSRVRIKIWQPGEFYGFVVGYSTTHGYLMLCVAPDVRPEWHIKDSPRRMVSLFAGIEVEPVYG